MGGIDGLYATISRPYLRHATTNSASMDRARLSK